MWSNSTPLAEVVLRVVVIYAALLCFVRLAGRRELGELGPLDLLAMLLLSETVSPALTAQDTSLPASLVAAATLLFLTAVVGRATFLSERLEKVIDGSPVVLARNGKLLDEALRRERISREEFHAALRRNGVARLEDVRLAVAEPQGEITIVPVAGPT